VVRQDLWTMARCRGKHDECPHKVSGSVAYPRENGVVVPKFFADLCRCDCHLRCPVAGLARVPDEEWLRSCTCPGSGQQRELEVIQGTEQRKAQVTEVFRNLDAGPRRSAAEMRQEVLDIAAARRAAYNAMPAPPPARRKWGPPLVYLWRPLTVPAILAAGVAVGAYFASGALQVILIVLAVLLSAIGIAWEALAVAYERVWSR
jgi:hypothetical protein